MAISTVTSFRGISDCKIASITTDTSAALTYGSLIDVPIQNLSFTSNIETYELKHDDNIQEVDTKLLSVDITGKMARVPLEVLAVMQGGTATASGSGASEVQTFDLDSSDCTGYFKLEIVSAKAMAAGADVADVHYQFKKCKITALPGDIADGFATFDFTAKCIATIYDSEIMNIVFNETAAAIA